jgi:hypothetical protein
MGTQVRKVGRDAARELFGPAEGQYVVFQDQIAVNDPPGGTDFCFDVFNFDLATPADELCLDIQFADVFATGAAYVELYYWDTCIWPDGGRIKVYAGETGGNTCLADVPAGSFGVYVHAMGVPTPLPYTLRISSDVPLVNPVRDANDDCDAEPGCTM